MRSGVIIFFLFASVVISCTDSKKRSTDQNTSPLKKASPKQIKPASGFTDTLKINFAAAIFYAPDSAQWQKLKLVNDTMVYSSFEHDCFFQMRNARNVIKQNFPGVRLIEVGKARYLLFEIAEGHSRSIDLDSLADPCGIFLFKKEKEPHPADMTNIDTELGFYFQ